MHPMHLSDVSATLPVELVSVFQNTNWIHINVVYILQMPYVRIRKAFLKMHFKRISSVLKKNKWYLEKH